MLEQAEDGSELRGLGKGEKFSQIFVIILEFSCFFDDPTNVDNLISSSFAFPKCSLNIWKFTFHVLMKPGLENFEHYFASM